MALQLCQQPDHGLTLSSHCQSLYFLRRALDFPSNLCPLHFWVRCWSPSLKTANICFADDMTVYQENLMGYKLDICLMSEILYSLGALHVWATCESWKELGLSLPLGLPGTLIPLQSNDWESPTWFLTPLVSGLTVVFLVITEAYRGL